MTQRETAKEIAARIRAGKYKPWFTETKKREGDKIISSIAV